MCTFKNTSAPNIESTDRCIAAHDEQHATQHQQTSVPQQQANPSLQHTKFVFLPSSIERLTPFLQVRTRFWYSRCYFDEPYIQHTPQAQEQLSQHMVLNGSATLDNVYQTRKWLAVESGRTHHSSHGLAFIFGQPRWRVLVAFHSVPEKRQIRQKCAVFLCGISCVQKAVTLPFVRPLHPSGRTTVLRYPDLRRILSYNRLLRSHSHLEQSLTELTAGSFVHCINQKPVT